VLWPLLHGRTDLMAYRRRALQGYLRVNRRFAQRVMEEAADADTIWVHDYHLIPLGGLLRGAHCAARIGFFLHTPLPPPYTLTSLPGHRALFGQLAAYDVIGVQTRADAEALRRYFSEECGARVQGDEVVAADGRRCCVRAFPIGIDPDALAELADRSGQMRDSLRLHESLSRRELLIGVDRLDYSKGLPHRLRAFGDLLNRYPDLNGKAIYLQITPKSRDQVSEYRNLAREVQRLVGDINGQHADPDWTPVRFLTRSLPHAVLAGFYRQARVCLVTSLRDGMNLVAKEFIACQSEADPGVLVLSEFAGAAADLAEVALIVNPYDTERCADAMARALSMPLAERRQRWRAGMVRLREGSVHRWGSDFLQALEPEVAQDDGSRRPLPSRVATASAAGARPDEARQPTRVISVP
jgi:trehalose 6-phosphate synthase